LRVRVWQAHAGALVFLLLGHDRSQAVEHVPIPGKIGVKLWYAVAEGVHMSANAA
jgi:hypothetical protein